MSDICTICGKKEPTFGGLVWYSGDVPEANLCKLHYRKWNKHHKPFVEKHKDVKPCTKEWEKMCAEESRLFKKWMKMSENEYNRTKVKT